MLEPFAVKPIGVVHSSVKEPRKENWQALESTIVVQDEWAGALDGLEAFSHIIVIYWMHLVSQELRRMTTHVHPRGDPQIPLQGVLATRSPVLHLRGLDAIDGTPVLDLKPYLSYYDGVAESTVPDWAQKPSEKGQRQES